MPQISDFKNLFPRSKEISLKLQITIETPANSANNLYIKCVDSLYTDNHVSGVLLAKLIPLALPSTSPIALIIT